VTDRLLQGLGAVVVGGSHGIGAAVATLMAELGAGVVVNGRDGDCVDATVDTITAAGGNAVGLSGSAADDSVAEALMALCENEFGALDALVNCAGQAEPAGSSILTVTSAEFHQLLDVHLGTVFATCRAAAERMAARGSGAIVNTSSVAFLGDYGGTGYPAGRRRRHWPTATSRTTRRGRWPISTG
jgi:NAD(P)-dependent dehydrogenase (short-subunit alcohol dehydrogenase family)